VAFLDPSLFPKRETHELLSSELFVDLGAQGVASGPLGIRDLFLELYLLSFQALFEVLAFKVIYLLLDSSPVLEVVHYHDDEGDDRLHYPNDLNEVGSSQVCPGGGLGVCVVLVVYQVHDVYEDYDKETELGQHVPVLSHIFD
jgi:hypothetical protein